MIAKNVARYCKDYTKIENYNKAVNDNTQVYEIHHRLELTLDGEFALSTAQLKMHDMYYHRPYYELIFLTKAEHTALHMGVRPHSFNERQKRSENVKGSKNPFYGKTHSEKFRKNHSKLLKGKTWKVIDGKRVWLSKEDN